MENILTVLTDVCGFILGAFAGLFFFSGALVFCLLTSNSYVDTMDRVEIIVNNLVNKPRLYKAQSDMIDRLQNENRKIRKQLRKEVGERVC